MHACRSGSYREFAMLYTPQTTPEQRRETAAQKLEQARAVCLEQAASPAIQLQIKATLEQLAQEQAQAQPAPAKAK